MSCFDAGRSPATEAGLGLDHPVIIKGRLHALLVFLPIVKKYNEALARGILADAFDALYFASV